MIKQLPAWLLITGGLFISGLLFYLVFLNHNGVNQAGAAYDSWDGTVSVQGPGWHLTAPTTFTVSLSTLPLPVTIPSEAKVINSKIVRLRPEGIADFVHMQGFSWMLNSKLDNILLGYAYSGKDWPFLQVIEEGKDVASAKSAKP